MPYCTTQPGICECKHGTKTSGNFAGIKAEFLTTSQHAHYVKWRVMRQDNIASICKLQNNLNDTNIGFCYMHAIEEIFARNALCLVECFVQLATHLNKINKHILQHSSGMVKFI